MKDQQEHIYLLLLQKRNGTISQPDDQYVTGQIGAREEVSIMWKAVEEGPSMPGEEYFWGQINAESAWEQVHERLQVKPLRRMRARKWLLAAAIVTIAATGIAVLWKPAGKRHPQQAATQTLPEQGLHLQLANGKTVTLPYRQSLQQISEGDVQLNAGSQRLQYTAGGNTGEGLNTLVVPPKMDYRITLSDGTEVWLNATSRLRFPFRFEGNKREVYIEGEAYFQVARQVASPFIVHTPGTDIEVLGTAFNVSAYKGGAVRTSLVNGKVTARAGTAAVTLEPGQEAVLRESNAFDVRPFDAEETLAWMRGVYMFHNSSLQEIAFVIERWFGVKVVFDDPAVARKRFTGGLEKRQSLEYFLETLQIIGNVRHSYAEEVVHLF